MSMKHIPDGQDFSASDFPREFGFQASSEMPPSAGPKPAVVAKPTTGGAMMAKDAKGGAIHPMGHQVIAVRHNRADGSVTHHHAHGGMTIHHADGSMTHHDEMGQPMNSGGGAPMRGGIENMHDSSEYAHRARGGHMEATEGRDDRAQDAKMIKSAIRQHDQHEHNGAHEDIHLRRGGYAGKRVGLPRNMKAKVEHQRSPIQSPKSMPATMAPSGPPPDMGGGALGAAAGTPSPDMGAPDMGPPDQGAGGPPPGMKRGGRAC